jgi:cytochrome b
MGRFYLAAAMAALTKIKVRWRIHIVGVVVTELREGGGLVSAMFTGRKVFDRKPADDV